MATVEDAVRILGKFIDEGQKLQKTYFRSDEFEEKTNLWTKRAIAQLRAWGLNEEAQRFNYATPSYQRSSDKDSRIYATITARISILKAVSDDISEHPEFYTAKTKAVPAAPIPSEIVPPPRIPSEIVPAGPRVQVKQDKVFLGHGRSLLWSKVERWLEKEKHIPVVAWETESHAGEHVIDVLKSFLEACTFAVLVVTGEDETALGAIRARQNVVHEIGLFQGKLGFKKVALLEQTALESFSNIDGLQTIPFPDSYIEGTFAELERMLKREGILGSPATQKP